MMLVIEFLILAFIVWEFAWKVSDWRKARRQMKEYEDDMAARLAGLSPEESTALMELVSHAKQPPNDAALSLQGKVLLIARDYVGWYVLLEHRDYLRRWAKEKSRQSGVQAK